MPFSGSRETPFRMLSLRRKTVKFARSPSRMPRLAIQCRIRRTFRREAPIMTSRLTIQLTLPMMGISLFLLLLGVGAAWYLERLQESTSRLLVDNVSSMRAAAEFEIGLRDLRNELSEFLRHRKSGVLKTLAALHKRSDELLVEIERMGTTAKDKEII